MPHTALVATTIGLEWVQMHSTGSVKLHDPDAKIKFLAAEALDELVVLSLTHSETVFPKRLRFRREWCVGSV